MNRRNFLFSTLLLSLLGCLPDKSGEQLSGASAPVREVSGQVFGSSYNIKYAGSLEVESWRRDLENFFQEFNRGFSTYQQDSVISRLNNLEAGKKLEVSPRFISMLELVRNLSLSTGGAFDPTIGPLIEAWGKSEGKVQTPSSEKVALALTHTGLKHLKWDGTSVWKTHPGIKLNLNAVAPGWAADLLGAELEKKAVTNYMIDIGGEILVKGHKAPGTPWVIGIEEPSQAPGHTIRTALKISDSSISTSGNYRQFVLDNGKRRSHIIDPRTGRPVSHQISSVTVIAPTAAMADAWGTALMVLGEEGIALAEKQGIKVLMLKGEEKNLTQVVSSEMKNYLKKNQL